jgi:hypothetical protein
MNTDKTRKKTASYPCLICVRPFLSDYFPFRLNPSAVETTVKTALYN